MIKRIIDLISYKYYSFSELLLELKEFGIKRKDLINYLKKIEKICKIKGYKFIFIPSTCKKCGFIAKDFKPISKCPKCKSEYLEEPKFFIKINYGNKED
jgi:predicted Zn-ribbon and HTH transcriptional regulator